MHSFTRVLIVSSLVLSGGCKKKKTEATPEPGSASAVANTGSAPAGSAAAGSAAGSGEGSAAAAGSGSAVAETVEPLKTCSATAWKEKTGLFCVDAPDFKAGKPEDYLDGDGTRIYFKREAKDGKPEIMFNVTWRKKTDDANAESLGLAGSMESDYKNNKGEEMGKFAGGKGRYVVFARKPEEKSHTLYSVVNGNKHAYSCEASSYDAPIAPELIAGCKSVIPTD